MQQGSVQEASQVWAACRDLIRPQIPDGVWHSTFQHVTPVAVEDVVLTLGVPSILMKERIETRYVALVRSALGEVSSPASEVTIIVSNDGELTLDLTQRSDDGNSGPSSDLRVDPQTISGRTVASSRETSPVLASPPGPTSTATDARYTFESFVQGASNRFAHAAALSVAETPARSYNPLFIYGSAGLGKTHLLQAIANYVSDNYPTYRVSYLSTETFLNEFVESIRRNSQPSFKRKYREIDVLLVDDIQFMEGKEGLQEEFFHTFNSLHQSNRQIVLSSDRPPDSIPTLEDRLRSRFKMGLITDIQPPDLETRLAILRKKAELHNNRLPDDVLEYIAQNITNNIRELEGALTRVSAYTSLNQEQPTPELAARILSDVLSAAEPRPITPKLILDETSAMFDFSVEEICGRSRRRPLVTARQIAMYVVRELTDLSYPAIAREFGGRDHTTVIHACEKIRNQLGERRQTYDQVTELTQRVKQA
ncbi:MAG: chromosomal replication initiator protein DnaA [Acidimicrobiales bacterium]